MTRSNKEALCVTGIIVGGLLTLAPAVGLVGTVIGMQRAFATLGASGVANPQQLADAIGQVLLSTFIGLVAFLPGVVLLITSIVFLKKPSRPPTHQP